MSELHYIGDAVNLAFRLVYTNVEAGATIGATVSVFGAEGELIHEDPVTIVDDVVKYTVNPSITNYRGNYAALFTFTFPNNQVKTHPMLFTMLPKGIPQEVEDLPVAHLDVESTDDEVEKAMGGAIRSLRKKGMSSGAAYDAAQIKTGKRRVI